MIFLGCDAGSSKTAYILADDQGHLLAAKEYPPCNYIKAGHDAFCATMKAALSDLCDAARVRPNQISCAAYGLTGYGEDPSMEREVPLALGCSAPMGGCHIVNDAVIGFAGALGGRSGIQIVSGTGSIAYGEDQNGNSARAGGWSLLFDDGGSACWIGRQTLAAFFRQADGRSARTALYALMLKALGLTEECQLHAVSAIRPLTTDRPALANLQLISKQAALAGDQSMIALYAAAAQELLEQVVAVKRKLRFPPNERPLLSYSGGVFKSGELILEPLRRGAEDLGLQLTSPRYPPLIGALAMAAKPRLVPHELDKMLQSTASALANQQSAT